MRNNKIKTGYLESRGRQAGYSVWVESGFFTASFPHPNLENGGEGSKREKE